MWRISGMVLKSLELFKQQHVIFSVRSWTCLLQVLKPFCDLTFSRKQRFTLAVRLLPSASPQPQQTFTAWHETRLKAALLPLTRSPHTVALTPSTKHLHPLSPSSDKDCFVRHLCPEPVPTQTQPSTNWHTDIHSQALVMDNKHGNRLHFVRTSLLKILFLCK